MTINGRIGLLRQRLGLSQRAFGERIGRSVGYISKVETGRIDVSPVIVSSIASTFGVSVDWLENGAGPLMVESVGDRIRQARKARDYTQEELAGELHISRNSVGMIERGTFRPGEEIITSLCDRLWIDQNWLITGQGNMERTELTPFYELLKHNPAIREHIRSYIEHLDRPRREEQEEPMQEDRWVTAYIVHDQNAARLFLAHYNIEYKEYDGKISVKAERDVDRERVHEIDTRLRKAGLANLRDHEFIWRDRDGNTLVTYSPYDIKEVRQTWIEKVEDNFYGHGTTTYLVRG